MDDVAQQSIFVGVGVAVVFTLVWMAVLFVCALRFSRITEGGRADKKAVALWLVSIAACFTGPCVGLLSLALLLLGVIMLRSKDANPRTRAAIVGAVAGSSVMVLMFSTMMAVYAVGGVFR